MPPTAGSGKSCAPLLRVLLLSAGTLPGGRHAQADACHPQPAWQCGGPYTELLASRWLHVPCTALLKLFPLRSSCLTTGSAVGRP